MAKGKRVPVHSIIRRAERPNHTVGGKAQSYGGHARPNHHTAGRQGLTGKQRPSSGGQRPSPTRAPASTSRRAGIGQGDLPHTRVTTSTSRMQGDHKEQHSSHSLNRWKKRLALQHRYVGMSTGSEPYILRGILSKGPWALMTRLGPSHERGPGTQPHKIVSEFSVRICYTAFYQCYDYNVTMFSIERRTNQYYKYNVTMCSIELSTKESVPIDRAVAQ